MDSGEEYNNIHYAACVRKRENGALSALDVEDDSQNENIIGNVATPQERRGRDERDGARETRKILRRCVSSVNTILLCAYMYCSMEMSLATPGLS